MARFRTSGVSSAKTVNKAGGEAFKQDAKLELVSLLLTSFVSDKFYEKANEQLDRLATLVAGIKDKTFAAKAAIFARNEYGMRSITHALIGELVHEVKGEEWTKRAVEKTVHRPDDMLEMLAYYGNKYGKPFPNSLKKGLASALGKFDGYQLAKYRGENSSVKMVDLFNLIHPKPGVKNVDVFKQLVAGELKNTETWEAKLSDTGKAETAEAKADAKKEAWGSLIATKKLGYFALLKNLRNIEKDAPESLDDALEMLVDPKLVKNSLVLPFRFNTAIKEVSNKKTVVALSKAIDVSMSNVPKFKGKSLIVLDTSGSMAGKPMEIGSLFAAVLYKANPDADLMIFGTDAQYLVPNPTDSTLTVAAAMQNSMGGTDFHSIFARANKAYDRIIILSDMQGWIGYDAPTRSLAAYNQKYSANPFIYSFDLNGYGSLQFPQPQVFAIAGFSEKVLDLFPALEEDKNALITKIESITL